MVCDKVSPGDRQDSNPNIDFVECDVSNKESFANAFKVTKERFGKLDVVINNAGVLMEARYEGNHTKQATENWTVEYQKHPKSGQFIVQDLNLMEFRFRFRKFY